LSYSTSENFTLKLISLRDPISKLSSEFDFENTMYMEIPIRKIEELVFQTNATPLFTSDLTKAFNPINLAESAVGLNLKLMKWRMAPDIDLDIIKT